MEISEDEAMEKPMISESAHSVATASTGADCLGAPVTYGPNDRLLMPHPAK